MTDKKISALTGATTPLAGTEVIPIVQSGATVKVASDDLTVKNIRSNATSGILQIAGPAAASTRVVTVPDANWTAARTDAAQSLTGDQTLSAGNLVQGTAAKGINFTANTPAAGMTSQLLNWYEEGTFTPVISGSTSAGAGTYTFQAGWYTKIGNRVLFNLTLGWSAHTGTGNILLSGLPFTSNSAGGLNYSPCVFSADGLSLSVSNTLGGYVNTNNTTISVLQYPVGGGSPAAIPMDTSVSLLFISGQYFV